MSDEIRELEEKLEELKKIVLVKISGKPMKVVKRTLLNKGEPIYQPSEKKVKYIDGVPLVYVKDEA